MSSRPSRSALVVSVVCGNQEQEKFLLPALINQSGAEDAIAALDVESTYTPQCMLAAVVASDEPEGGALSALVQERRPGRIVYVERAHK